MSFACRHCLVALRPVTSPPRSFTVFPDDSIYRAQLRMHQAFRLASIAPKLIVPTSWLLSFSISGGDATAPCYSAVKKKASWNFIHSIHSYFVETPENFPKLSSQRIGLDTAFIIGLPEWWNCFFPDRTQQETGGNCAKALADRQNHGHSAQYSHMTKQ